VRGLSPKAQIPVSFFLRIKSERTLHRAVAKECSLDQIPIKTGFSASEICPLKLRSALSADEIRREYSLGMSNSDVIAPESYTLDAALMAEKLPVILGGMAQNALPWPC
jgi:hypothetical protein